MRAHQDSNQDSRNTAIAVGVAVHINDDESDDIDNDAITNDEIVYCAKVVMGEEEILKYKIKKEFGDKFSLDHIHSIVQTDDFDWEHWLSERLADTQGNNNKKTVDIIRTTPPNAIIGQETHYIGVVIHHEWRKILFLNSEPVASRRMTAFKIHTKQLSSRHGYQFLDLSPRSEIDAFQIHEHDTFCQSWTIFILCQVLQWQPITEHTWKHVKTEETTNKISDIYPKKISSSMTPEEKYNFIRRFVFDTIMETNLKFDFDVDYQFEVEFHKKIPNLHHALVNALVNDD